MNYAVDADIAVASTLDRAFYRDEAAWAAARERIFARAWQWIGDLSNVAATESLSPRDFLPGLLDEPLLLARDGRGVLRCMSNVCTHRGNLLVKEACKSAQIRCGYHSRRFDLSGRMTFMPEFQGAKGFPSPADDLAQVPFAAWANHGFAGVEPAAPFDAFFGDMIAHCAWMPVEHFIFDASRSREYVIDAHWALYVENYLEGFHIPFVHAALNDVVDYGTYSSELHRYSSVQRALANPGQAAFELPPGAVDNGLRVAAYYWWVFPNLMFNFYPWGLSINIVQPDSPDRTRIAFHSYVWEESKMDTGAGAALDQVEREDEAIVEAVHRGVRSRFYGGGRYSPTRERGVHHFHRLLGTFMSNGTETGSADSA